MHSELSCSLHVSIYCGKELEIPNILKDALFCSKEGIPREGCVHGGGGGGGD